MMNECWLIQKLLFRNVLEKRSDESFYNLLLLDLSCYDNKHIVFCIKLLFMIEKIILSESADVIFASYDLPSVAIVSIHISFELFIRLAIWPVLIHLKFLYHDEFLSFHFFFGERWCNHHVGKDIECLCGMFRSRFYIVSSILFCCERIKLTTKCIYICGYIMWCCIFLSSLKKHMFKKMADAICISRLIN